MKVALLKQVSNAISVTNKLLSISERQKIIDFFIINLKLFKELISHFYPINVVHLRQFQNFWNWSFTGISRNEKLTGQMI